MAMMASTRTMQLQSRPAVSSFSPSHRTPLAPVRRSLRRSATDGGEPTPEQQKPASPPPAAVPPPPTVVRSTEPKESLVRGQGTAIVTGAISIIFGVAYLALVSFMDQRGGGMLPPPPEAYLP